MSDEPPKAPADASDDEACECPACCARVLLRRADLWLVVAGGLATSLWFTFGGITAALVFFDASPQWHAVAALCQGVVFGAHRFAIFRHGRNLQAVKAIGELVRQQAVRSLRPS